MNGTSILSPTEIEYKKVKPLNGLIQKVYGFFLFPEKKARGFSHVGEKGKCLCEEKQKEISSQGNFPSSFLRQVGKKYRRKIAMSRLG
jgi:hypothetical protein